MRFVLEHDEIFFGFAVDLRIDADRAGVDLVGNIQIIEPSLFFQFFHRDGGDVHQARVFIFAFRVEFFEQIAVQIVGFTDMRIVRMNIHALDLRRESRVAAMVRPVRIDDLDFRFGGIAAFLFEIIAHENKIFHTHGETAFCVIVRDLVHAHVDKARDLLDVLRLHFGAAQRFGLVEGNFFALHGVDEMFFDTRKFRVGHALDGVHARAAHQRARLAR